MAKMNWIIKTRDESKDYSHLPDWQKCYVCGMPDPPYKPTPGKKFKCSYCVMDSIHKDDDEVPE